MYFKNLCSIVIVGVVLSANLFAQKVEEAYLGALYTGVANNSYTYTNVVEPRAAAKVSFDVASGQVYVKSIYIFNKAKGGAYYQRKIGALNMSAGFIPRPIAIINRPSPTSADANFESLTTKQIRAASMGMLGSAKLFKTILFAGVYQTGADSADFNIGFKKNIGGVNFGAGGYIANYNAISGHSVYAVAGNIEFNNFTVVGHVKNDVLDILTRSVFASYNITEETSVLADIVHTEHAGWELFEVGVTKKYTKQTKFLPINYVLGLTYIHSDMRPNSVNVYLQIYIAK